MRNPPEFRGSTHDCIHPYPEGMRRNDPGRLSPAPFHGRVLHLPAAQSHWPAAPEVVGRVRRRARESTEITFKINALQSQWMVPKGCSLSMQT